MSNCVLDSSALLCVLRKETGAAAVLDTLPGANMSAVHFAEVMSKLCDSGLSKAEALLVVELTGVEIIPFDADQAAMAGELRPVTRSLGLSLGDRACLALARSLGVPAVTADKAWAGLDGFDITIIR